MGTFWTIRNGFSTVVQRTLRFPQSPLYCILSWVAVRLGEPIEIVLRFPSVLAMALASLLLYRLGTHLFEKETALHSVILFVSFPPVAFAAADARPYAFALVATIGALWMLVRWLENGRLRHACAYVALAAATVHFHFLFATTLVGHALYAAGQLRGPGPVRTKHLLAAASAIAVLLLPLTPFILGLLETWGSRTVMARPSLGMLVGVFAPTFAVGSLFIGWLLAAWLFPGVMFRQSSIPRRVFLLILASLGVPTISLYVISRIGPFVFLPRYLLCTVPGLVLLAGWAVRAIEPVRARHFVAAAQLLTMLALQGTTTQHTQENWRSAAEVVRRITSGTSTPVLLSGTFAESANLEWLSDPKHLDYLLAPFSVYPPGGTPLVLPIRRDEKSEAFVDKLIATSIGRNERIVLIERSCFVLCSSWESWLGSRLSPRGFGSKNLGVFGTIAVSLFERKQPARP